MTSEQKRFPRELSSRQSTAPTQAKPLFRSRAGAFIGLAAVLGLAMAGCSTPSGGSATTAPATSMTAPTAEATASATAGDTASSGESPTPSPSAVAATSAAPATNAAPALCTAASLKGSLDDTGGGAAGHIYMKLILTNKSATTCILNGYPGVSLVKTGTTTPIGAPADRDPAAPSKGPITLAPGKAASAVFAYTQADNYQNCQRVQAGGVMVYPPSAYDELVVPHPLTACSNAEIKLLKIGAFQP